MCLQLAQGCSEQHSSRDLNRQPVDHRSSTVTHSATEWQTISRMLYMCMTLDEGSMMNCQYVTGGCATATCRRSVIVCLAMRRRWSSVTRYWSLSSRRCANNCWTSFVPRRTKCRRKNEHSSLRIFHGRRQTPYYSAIFVFHRFRFFKDHTLDGNWNKIILMTV